MGLSLLEFLIIVCFLIILLIIVVSFYAPLSAMVGEYLKALSDSVLTWH